jgi:hypothetical protein
MAKLTGMINALLYGAGHNHFMWLGISFFSAV